jgi:hypothetical protein
LIGILSFEVVEMVGSKKRSISGEQLDTNKVGKVGEETVVQQIGQLSDVPDDQSKSNKSSPGKESVDVTAIVSPEKPAPTKRFYLMNTKTGHFVETENSISANELKRQLVRLGSESENSFAVAKFYSESDVKAFLKEIYNVPKPNDQTSKLPITANNSVNNIASVGDSCKMPAIPNPSINSERNVTNAAHCRDIVVLEDDVVPFRSVQPETPRLASASLSSSQIDDIRAVTLGIGARIEVYRWSLPACKFDVYSYKLMMGPNMYWTHKPTMWIDLVRLDTEKSLLKSPDSMSLHEAMDHCHAAAIRATPGGPNTALSITTQKTRKIYQHLLYGLVQKEKPDSYIAEQIKKFVRFCDDPRVRQSYNCIIKNLMTSNPAVDEDTREDGKYWYKLKSGANNILFIKKRRLNEVFLDDDIVSIIETAYGLLPPVLLWPPHVQAVAYGQATDDV